MRRGFHKEYGTKKDAPTDTKPRLLRLLGRTWQKIKALLQASAATVAKRWKIISLSATCVLAFFGFFGGYPSFIAYISPSISVSPAFPLATDASIKAPFEITNESAYPIYDLHYTFENCTLIPAVGGGLYSRTIVDKQFEIPPIGPYGSVTKEILSPIAIGEITNGDITFVLVFKFQRLWWQFNGTQKFRFVARKGQDQETHWYRESVINDEDAKKESR